MPVLQTKLSQRVSFVTTNCKKVLSLIGFLTFFEYMPRLTKTVRKHVKVRGEGTEGLDSTHTAR